MLDFLFSNPFLFIAWAIALLVAITVHEFAHAFVADKLGDPTPRLQGRLTLNPLAHLDPIGTLMLLLVRFGWGKPVVFDLYNLKNPKRDSALISLAGPASNLIVASILAVLVRIITSPFSPVYFLVPFLLPVITLNVMLAIFNLIPIHPLDGGKILVGLLPDEDAEKVDLFLRQSGLILLMFLILPLINGRPAVYYLINPVINTILSILLPGQSLV